MSHTVHKLRIVAAIAINSQREILLVRKRGTTAFMQPGGKIEPLESEIEALQRELTEELSWSVAPQQIERVGTYSAVAAHEADTVVRATLFVIHTDERATPNAELAEARWVSLGAARSLELAPLTRDHVLPIAAARCHAAVGDRETDPE